MLNDAGSESIEEPSHNEPELGVSTNCDNDTATDKRDEVKEYRSKNAVVVHEVTGLHTENSEQTELAKENSDEQLGSKAQVTNMTLLAPRPSNVQQTGLNENLLIDLLLKTLHVNGACSIRKLVDYLALSGGVIQELIELGKSKSLIENTSRNLEGEIRFEVSHLGAAQAEKAMVKSGYLGKAPVPLSQYQKICRAQSNRTEPITHQEFNEAFSDVVFPEEMIEKVGPALNSSKPILIYGLPGTGKSFFCRQLNRIFGDDVLIPHAIEVNNEIIQVFDPEIHQVNEEVVNTQALLKLEIGHDPRWIKCQRPLVITGGELSLEMLETRFDPNSKTYRAPLQVKANNGILLLDDLGRQKISPKELFNRWIIPLEERRDFLSLQSGLHFEVPFELLMLFSTNLDPNELIDDAFLRRLGYKIPFAPMEISQYQQIWLQTCKDLDLQCKETCFEYLIDKLHKRHNKAYLPCYPRDLLTIIHDQVAFKKLPNEVTEPLLDFAWQSYFV
ncbi:P-loop NTPase family protein [Thalassotalea litorea]|uniref:AAA family ATPase n=1 Tax=Thalassotalea litorea TaxID=2020715 RepID=UPI003734F1C9